MSLVALDPTNFNDVINDNPIVVIGFGRPGEEHTRELGALLEACAAKNPDVTFATCDVAAVPEAQRSFHIATVPTVVVFREQIMLFAEPSEKRSAWLRSQDRLDLAVSRIKQIDMPKLRQMASAAEAAAALRDAASAGG